MINKKKNIIELSNIDIENYKALEKRKRIIVADNIRSMHNIGSLFRTLDAFRWQSILLCGISATPPNAEIKKTALGAENSVDWCYENDIIKAIEKLKNRGWKICVLEQVHGSIPLFSYLPKEEEKIALVVGNEVEGVNQKIVDKADIILEIPQEGTKHSLNVAVSAGMAMYQLTYIK